MKQDSPDSKLLLPNLHMETRKILEESDLDRLHWRVYDLVRKAFPLDAFYIGYYSEEHQTLQVLFLVDEDKQYPGFTESLESSIARHTIANRQATVLNNSRDIAELLKSDPKAVGQSQKVPESIISSPLISAGKVSGVISVQSYRAGAYSSEAAKILDSICAQIAFPLQQARQKQAQGKKPDRFSPSPAAESRSKFPSESDYAKLANQNEKLKSIVSLARGISHEMNQPLTGISGYCALIREELKEDHLAYEDLNQIEIQAHRLEQLICNFQSIAQLEDVDDINSDE